MSSELLSWLMTPLSGASTHSIATSVAWHGRLMVLAWGFLLPLAVVLARYYKVMPNQDWPRELDRKFWWHGHRWLAYGASGLTGIGVYLVFQHTAYAGELRQFHSMIGWSLVVLMALQLLGAHLRGSKGGPTSPRLGTDGRILDLHGDHYDMTPRRILFERIHKTLGTAAVCLAFFEIAIGLHLADAPRWMWLGLVMWWLVLAAWVYVLQVNGRCVDTYQAIWGPDPSLPGARVKPFGWGIRISK